MTESEPIVMDWQKMQSQWIRRKADAHKGDFGHVLVVGGDEGMGGAVRMAAEAALRVGCGLVSVATRFEHVIRINETRPEIMCHAITKIDDVNPLLAKAMVIVLGPGLGKSTWSRDLFHAAMVAHQPKIVDADALNILSEAPYRASHWILTPHAGEAARLLYCSVSEIQHNRLESIRQLLKKYGGVIVLKGAGTIVQTENQSPHLCPLGNPGMATAGMGDVLSGVIGGLVAQGFSLFHAATMGVMLHARAADLAATADGERGLIATDLMPYLRQLVNPNGFFSI